MVGNQRFRDGDILATSGLQTGVLLGQDELIAAHQALEFTGEFRDVVITSSGSVLIITVDEAPQYSGGLTFGLGYDTDTGVFGAVGLALNDAFGGNTQLRSNLLVAKEVQTLSFGVYSDQFWSANRRGGVRLALANYDYDNTVYNYRSARIEPYANFELSQNADLEVRYVLASRDVRNVSATASPILINEAGRQTSSGIGFKLRLGPDENDTNRFFDNWSFVFDQEFTGLGGDTKLSISRLALAARKNISESGFALRTRFEFGAAVGRSGEKARVSERFTLGGAALRGFERGTISPRDVCTGCAAGGGDQITELGGNYYAVARTDLLVPIFQNAPDLETFAFFDFGSVWSTNTTTAPSGVLDDTRRLRSSAGVGLSFATALGDFEAYLALTTNAERYDEEEVFGLLFRAQF